MRFVRPGTRAWTFTGDGRGCNTIQGRFDVLEIVRDASQNVVKLAVNWEQHCEGGQPALYGQLRYNSDVPLSAKPIHIHVQNALNFRGCVEATSPNGAQVTVDGLGIADSQGAPRSASPGRRRPGRPARGVVHLRRALEPRLGSLRWSSR
jgi:hypothetical protein